VVIGLFLLIYGITTALGGWTQGTQELDFARETVRNDLFMARKGSTAGTNDSSWGIRFATSSITRFKGSSYAARDTVYDATTQFGSRITITAPTEIVFLRPSGTPNATGTITITDGRKTVTSTVNRVGGIDFP